MYTTPELPVKVENEHGDKFKTVLAKYLAYKPPMSHPFPDFYSYLPNLQIPPAMNTMYFNQPQVEAIQPENREEPSPAQNESSQTPSKNAKAISCSICHKQFMSVSNLRQHEQIHQNKDNRSKFSCHLCTASYLYKCNLIRHVKMHSQKPKKNSRPIESAASNSNESDLPLTIKEEPYKVVKQEENPQIDSENAPHYIQSKLYEFLCNDGQSPISALTQAMTFYLPKKFNTTTGLQRWKVTIEPVAECEKQETLDYEHKSRGSAEECQSTCNEAHNQQA